MDIAMLKTWLAWGMANPVIVLAVVVWIVANVMVRPHPDQMTGWKKVLWTAVDRVSILTADKLPGALKLPLVASPTSAAVAVAAQETADAAKVKADAVPPKDGDGK